MQVTISGHHTDTGQALRVYVEEHLQKIKKYFDKEVNPKVFFQKDHNMFKAEILLKDMQGTHAEFFADGEDSDIHRAFEIAVHKLDHQLRKYHDKVKNNFKKKMKNNVKEINADLAFNPNA